MKPDCALRRAAFVALAGALLGSGGCARWDALMRADQIERQAKAAEARSLQRQSDAYFLIGMEYYNLAVAAEKSGDAVRTKECATKSGMYNALSKSLGREAEEARMTPGPGSAPTAAPPAAAAAPAPPVVPVAPAPSAAPVPRGGSGRAASPQANQSGPVAPSVVPNPVRVAPPPSVSPLLPEIPSNR